MVPRLALYGATSTALAGLVVGSALHTRANFFAAAVAVGRSSGALMVLANYALFNAICAGIAVKVLFFGQLRSIEYEHLFERLWLFLTESLLALTIFRDDFSLPFACMYGVLLFLKCFHWITADRVDYMDQVPPPGPPPLFHLRISTIISLLMLLDLVLVLYSLETITIDGISSTILFASEFMILLASIGGTLSRYVIGLVDIRRARGRADAPSWEEKSMYIFYVDLTVDFVKLLTYLTFFTVILLNYGLPLHILRDVYMTLRSFLARCGDLVRYRRATRDMDAQYPSATSEEMDALADKTCIICREEMVADQPQHGERHEVSGRPNETPKKLACGHIFHFHCLRSWLERQQSCPTCRRDVLRPPSRPTPRAPPRPPAPGAAPGALPAPPAAPVNPDPMDPLFRLGMGPLRLAYEQYERLVGRRRLQVDRGRQPRELERFFADRNGHDDRAVPTGIDAHPNDQQGAIQPGVREENLQLGIWGGPITPGQFLPRPLGATSRSTSYRPRVIPPPSTIPHPPPTIASPTDPSVRQSSHVPQPSAGLPTPPSAASLPSPRIGSSGVNTPHSSDPPQVFSSTRTTRADATGYTGSERTTGDSGVMGDTARRSQAAEAAVRRSQRKRSTLAATESDTTVEGVSRGDRASSDKGKVKETTELEGLDDPPKYRPFLSSLTAPHLPVRRLDTPNRGEASARSMSPGEMGRGKEHAAFRDMAGTTLELDERIRVLKEVDDVVWELVGELTKMKSRWEEDDMVERAGN